MRSQELRDSKSPPALADETRLGEWLAYFGIGVRNTDGYGAELTIDAYLDWGGLIINTTESSPGDDCIVTQAITWPYAAYKFDIPSPRPYWYANDHESVVNKCGPDTEELQEQLAEHDNGLLQVCHYTPKMCMDDCSRGVDMATIEFN
jgi:hypothetical protein